LDGVQKSSGSSVATGREFLHVLHDESWAKATFAGEEEVFLESPREGIGPSNLAPGPAVWNGVVGVTTGAVAIAIKSGGSMQVRMQYVEPISEIVSEKWGK
jgi:hypothetical protein